MSKFGHSVGKGWLANIVKAGFDTITGNMIEISQRKKTSFEKRKTCWPCSLKRSQVTTHGVARHGEKLHFVKIQQLKFTENGVTHSWTRNRYAGIEEQKCAGKKGKKSVKSFNRQSNFNVSDESNVQQSTHHDRIPVNVQTKRYAVVEGFLRLSGAVNVGDVFRLHVASLVVDLSFDDAITDRLQVMERHSQYDGSGAQSPDSFVLQSNAFTVKWILSVCRALKTWVYFFRP